MSLNIRLLLFFIFLSSQSFAQKERLDLKGVYKRALQEYLKRQPGNVVAEEEGKFLFLKHRPYMDKEFMKQPYTYFLPDSIGDVKIVIINTDSASMLSEYFSGKRKFTIVQMDEIFARASVNYVYFFPIKATWKHRKNKLGKLKYDGHICHVDFDYRTEGEKVVYSTRDVFCLQPK